MKGNEIRETFLSFFSERDHRVVKSSSLVPEKDPTLLFTNAGMVPFKSYFLGQEEPEFSRAASAQKCLRISGKHNDLENVGRTSRHHTFFEMLGNFSFGDYFKEEAIHFSWEFLVKVLKLPKERLWVTVYREDREAADLWVHTAGLSEERVVPMAEKDNFWSMGETGPCGPCSEILIDQGKELGCGRADCRVGCDCDRYLEIWNLVFMQYNRSDKGVLSPLPKPSIDTGMGLERLAAVLQGVKSNYDSDLLRGIILRIEEGIGRRYGQSHVEDVSMRVIADHARAMAFLIADGVLPENDGRGYVLRRIIRRAARHARNLGLKEPFLYCIVEEVANQFASAYSELSKKKDFISKIVKSEEERFGQTLERGLELLTEAVTPFQTGNQQVLPGEVAFKLYDTYGFPIDLTEDLLREKGMRVDLQGFQRLMEQQKERARGSQKGLGTTNGAHEAWFVPGSVRVTFLGYDREEARSEVILMTSEGQKVQECREGERVDMITVETPFYGESGGQVGDTGWGAEDGLCRVEIVDTLRPTPELIVHRGVVREGRVRVGSILRLSVDRERRQTLRLNHSATHILHAVLREVLGEHVKQAGSLVAPGHLRFDFSHFGGIEKEVLHEIEAEVNCRIRNNQEVETSIMDFEEAVAAGAIALFEEKYSDQVRVVKIGDYSKELCGGTHVDRAGDIGLFKIKSEGGISVGVRRIEALTGGGALSAASHQESVIRELRGLLRGSDEEILGKVKGLLDQQKELERRIESLNQRLAGGLIEELLRQAQEIRGIKVISAEIADSDPKALRDVADRLRKRLGSGVVALGSTREGKAFLLAAVTKDLTGKIRAGRLIQQMAPLVGGKGGGRDDRAQAGGPSVSGLSQALRKVFDLLE
jgi:alanyl-tRNA synthetase